MTLEELKDRSIDGVSDYCGTTPFGAAMGALFPEIMALVEAATDAQWDYRNDDPICVALDAFNAKLETL